MAKTVKQTNRAANQKSVNLNRTSLSMTGAQKRLTVRAPPQPQQSG